VTDRRLADDYDALRHGVGLAPVGRDILRLAGADAVEYLQGQCSQDIAALAIGQSADALVLTPQGKLDALIRVTRAGDEELYVDVDAGYGEALSARLARFKLRVKVDITILDWTCLALRGPDAAALADAPVAPGASLALPFVWGSVSGVDVFGADPVPVGDVRRCGVEAWESVRIEAGIPVMGAELDDRTIAAEADLLDRCVSFTKGCYTGQELVARLDARGNKVARRLAGLVVDRAQGLRPPVAAGSDVRVGDRVVGRLTSVAWSPALDTVVALGYLHRHVEPPCPVTLGAVDGKGDIAAEARPLPLVG
jgi:folate-binding protein YgfZ